MPLEALRTPDERFAFMPQFPYAPRYVDDLSGYEQLRMAYVDEGPPDAQTVFLCLHGEPTWGYLYRKMLPVFSQAGHRVVVPDLLGFGRSDKPVDDEAYTIDFHRESLLRLIERLDLTDITLVCQDWGGILGLTLPMEMPDRFTRLLVMNTGLPIGEPVSEGFAHRYRAGVRRFPQLVPVEPGMDGIDLTRRARKFFSEDWAGESFMAVGLRDAVLGADVMKELRGVIRGCPEPMEVPEAGHFVQEYGEPIARAALAHFGLE